MLSIIDYTISRDENTYNTEHIRAIILCPDECGHSVKSLVQENMIPQLLCSPCIMAAMHNTPTEWKDK